MRPGRDEIDRAKRQIRQKRDLKMLADFYSEVNRIAREEIAAEESGGTASDQVTREEVVRRTLVRGCEDVRAKGSYPSKVRVAEQLNMSRSVLWRLWVDVRATGEEWPPA